MKDVVFVIIEKNEREVGAMSEERVEEMLSFAEMSGLFRNYDGYGNRRRMNPDRLRGDEKALVVYFRDEIGEDVIRIPSEYPELPDLECKRKLPKLYDGNFLVPTMIPLNLTSLGRLLGLLPKYTSRAEVLFGSYRSDGAFLLSGAKPSHALIKVICDATVSQVIGGIGSEDSDQLEAAIRRQVRDALISVTVIDNNDYGICSEVYIVIMLADIDCSGNGWDSELWGVYEAHEAGVRALLKESAERLAVFEDEKGIWREKIFELIPESWAHDLPGRRIVESENVIFLEEGNCDLRVEARYDKVGYEKVKKMFGGNVVAIESETEGSVL